MPGISIVRVENPSCLWGRTVCSPGGGDTQTVKHYNDLLLQMNLFYHDATQDVEKFKPKTLEEKQVCVVYWTVNKVWCRAVVELIITDSVSSKARCLLVDYGDRIVIPSDQIRVAMPDFLELPFWVKKFELAGIKPTTLRVFFDEEKAVLMPSSQWDSSATLHLHNLLQLSTQTEAVLVECTSDCSSIELYLTLDNVKICVNDDLVAKKFAYYSREASDSGFQDEEDEIMTSSMSILCTSRDLLTSKFPHQDNQTVDSSLLVSNEQPKNTRTSNGDVLSKSIGKCPSITSSNKVLDNSAAESLLEWFNPEPLKVNDDAADIVFPLTDPRKSAILVHSALPLEPCSSLDDAPITDTLCRLLRRKQYSSLSPADCYSWPAVAQGRNTVIISHNAVQPLSYLTPLLTHILLNSLLNLRPSTSGPIAVLICPGWEKVQAVYYLLDETKVAHVLHPIMVDHGVSKNVTKAEKIPENCLLLVTTPFSLVRLLSSHCFLFRRIYHMVLDEADRLFSVASEQMVTILQHFSKVVSIEERASCPQQLVVTAKRWSNHMEGLIVNHMPHPCIVISIPEEAALYGNVQQIMVMTQQNSKISELSGLLDLNPEVGQKTLIIANSCQEVEAVFKAVSNKSAFCLKAHEGLTHQFDFVIEQWRKDIGPSNQIVLVTTNECLKGLGIKDASCVFHYNFPSSPKLFGSRLFCMAENFRNLSEQGPNKSICKDIKSVLLISEKNARHVVGVLRYLGRTSTPLPPQLLSFAEKIHLAREDRRTNRPLCSYLKSFGSCRDSNVCPDRHRFIPKLDFSVLPSSGIIEVVPLYVKTASVYYGRIIKKEDQDFDTMCSEMISLYSDKKTQAKELLTDGLYAVQEEESFHRVRILSVPDRGGRLFFCVLVRFIDVGKEKEVKSHQILDLPERFHSLPAQAVELVVCRVKPADAEIDWHPKITRLISQKIRCLQHQARVVFSVANTVFLDPMVRVSRVPGLKTFINEYNVQSEILTSGMGISNPNHVDLLKTLCQETCQSSEETSSSLELRVEAEDEVLAEAFRAAALWKFNSHYLEPLTPTPTADESFDQIFSAAEVNRLTPQSLIHKDKGSTNTQPAQLINILNPRILWYQTRELIIVTVKLSNPESQSCQFTTDRVVYSGTVSGRSYRADLDLHQNILPEHCCWEIKSNEPVLKLVKQQQTCWERLVKNKNIFVSYDLDHVLSDEDETPNGRVFMENQGESDSYVISDSDSDSGLD